MFKYNQQVLAHIDTIIDKHATAMRKEVQASLDFFTPASYPRRTNDHKRSEASNVIYRSPELSNKELAEQAGVSTSLIREVRKDAVEEIFEFAQTVGGLTDV